MGLVAPDKLTLGNRFRQLPRTFWTPVQPEPLNVPRLVAFSTDAAALVGIDPVKSTPELLCQLFSGQASIPGSEPIASVYSGHQFGGYTAQLGDGRAHLLGDVAGQDGQRWELQLKGSGRTPYSRHGDGRAALRSVIREYLCSEAMAALNIPTTRALSVVASETQIYRNGIEFAATMVRLSPSHIRFGHFEYFYYSRQPEAVRQLADFVIEHHYPSCADAENPYLEMFTEVVKRTARLVAQWQAIGFCHGVMNTDNMSVLGLTLDYGPFAFMDDYLPGYICNQSDEHGRYAYDKQPSVALWNCVCLAQALTGLVKHNDLEQALALFEREYGIFYTELMKQKLGIQGKDSDDAALITDFLDLLKSDGVDYTRSFNLLEQQLSGDRSDFIYQFSDKRIAGQWLSRWQLRTECDAGAVMAENNPRLVLRNFLAQQAIEAAENGDYSVLTELHSALRTPYINHENPIYSQTTPEWGKNLPVSCSS